MRESVRMKWTIGAGGGILGLVAAGGLMIAVNVLSPGMPGRSELLMQLMIVAFCSAVLGAVGFALGGIVDFWAAICRKKHDEPGDDAGIAQ